MARWLLLSFSAPQQSLQEMATSAGLEDYITVQVFCTQVAFRGQHNFLFNIYYFDYLTELGLNHAHRIFDLPCAAEGSLSCGR